MKAPDMGPISRLSAFVADRMALHYPPPRWGDLERLAGPVFAEMGVADADAFLDGPQASALTEDGMESLANHLTIGETYFWREPRTFEALEGQILPELIASRGAGHRNLRIWSAGCSTGEEAYSIAIALSRTLPRIDDWNITILATDLDRGRLRRAEDGQYPEWSFRGAPPWLKDGYFSPVEAKAGMLKIAPEIRRMVSFAYSNLADGIQTDTMDIIFCRNVLMYLNPEKAKGIVDGFHAALVDSGWLLVGACESSQLLFPDFLPAQFLGATAYRKHPARSQEPSLALPA